MVIIQPERKWMLGVYGVITVEHKPKLLCIWLTGNYSKQMEEIPEELFRNQTLQLVERFFGRDYNVTQPKEIKRLDFFFQQIIVIIIIVRKKNK